MSLSPRQVESVEQWLDDQPVSLKEKDAFPAVPTVPIAPPPSQARFGAFKEFKNTSRPNYSRPQYTSVHPPLPEHDHGRDLHVHSRLQMHSRFSRRDADDNNNADFVDPVECFLRVCSACLGSAALAVGAVTFVLVHRSSSTPSSGNPLDNRLGWVIAVPVAAAALLWQLTRLSLLAWHGRRTMFLLGLDLFAECMLSVGSVICSILAGFQATRHTAYNKRHMGNKYTDVGPEISLVVLLALLSFSSFGILALNVVEANRIRREGNSSNRSTSSSVIEIIH